MFNVEIHRSFVEQNWPALSAGAQKGYRLSGRGAFFVNVVKMLGLNLAPYAVVAYMPNQTTPWPNARVEELVMEYDPSRELAVFFLDPTEGIVAYKASSDHRQIHLVEY